MFKKIFIFLMSWVLITGANAKKIISDTEIENVLTEIIAPLANAADIPDTRLKIYVIGDDEFNAFVSGGENVFIHSGLLTDIKSVDELQAVVAHELAHMVGGHIVQMSDRMQAEFARSMVIQALGIGLMAVGGDPSLGMGVLAGASGVAQQSMMAFTRDEERMADDIGLKLMVDAELNPDGFVQVLEHMQELTSGFESKINPNNVKHPLTGERLQNVREKISSQDYKYKPNREYNEQLSQKYEMVRAKLIGYLYSKDRVYTIYTIIDNSLPAIYASTLSDVVAKDFSAARIGVNQLISRNDKNPYFYELRGDLEYANGNYDASITAYDKALELIDDSAPQIETALANVLSARRDKNDVNRAITLCKKALLYDKNSTTYWVLSKLYTDGRSDWARAEYYAILNQDDMAKKYAKIAQSKLKKNTPEYIKSGDILD